MKYVTLNAVRRGIMIGTYPQGSINDNKMRQTDNKMRQTDNQKSPNIPKMILPVSVVRVINIEGSLFKHKKTCPFIEEKEE